MMTPLAVAPVARSASCIGTDAGVAAWVATELGIRTGTGNGVSLLAGVGVDMVDTEELADLIESSGPSFMDLCWTPSEQTYCGGSISRLAARWAAKEATMKALGHGIGEIDPTDIEVVSIEGEPPGLLLHGSAEYIAGQRRMSRLAVSLTHESIFAMAFVVALCEAALPETGTEGYNPEGLRR